MSLSHLEQSRLKASFAHRIYTIIRLLFLFPMQEWKKSLGELYPDIHGMDRSFILKVRACRIFSINRDEHINCPTLHDGVFDC